MHDRPLVDLVTRRDPVTLPPEATVQQACRAMRTHRVGCVLVTDAARRLLGIFTGRDAIRLAADSCDTAATPLSEAMTHAPQVLPSRATALQALRLMQDGGFRHVPLVEGDIVVGVVSRGDFRAMEHARLDDETGLWEMLR